MIWSYISEYDKNIIPFKNSYLNNLINHAINYYKDFILPNKKYKLIEENNIAIFNDLKKYTYKTR